MRYLALFDKAFRKIAGIFPFHQALLRQVPFRNSICSFLPVLLLLFRLGFVASQTAKLVHVCDFCFVLLCFLSFYADFMLCLNRCVSKGRIESICHL